MGADLTSVFKSKEQRQVGSDFLLFVTFSCLVRTN